MRPGLTRRSLLLGLPLAACASAAKAPGQASPFVVELLDGDVSDTGYAAGTYASSSGGGPLLDPSIPNWLSGTLSGRGVPARVLEVYRGRGNLVIWRDVDPAANPLRHGSLLPPMSNGVVQLTASDFQLYILPDRRTWLFTRGVPAHRMQAQLEKNAGPPPQLVPEPGSVISQTSFTGPWRIAPRVLLGPARVLGEHDLRAVSHSAFPRSPTGSIPVLSRLGFADSSMAERAAADYRRALANGDARRGDDETVTFWLRSIREITTTGADMVVKSELRADTFR